VITYEPSSASHARPAGLVLASAGVVQFAGGMLLAKANVPYALTAAVLSVVTLTVGTAVSAREHARTRSKHAAWGIGLGCGGLVAFFALVAWVLLDLPHAT